MIQASNSPTPLTAERSPWLRGPIRLPGDPARSQLALLLGAMARGDSTIENLNAGASVAGLCRALEQLGVHPHRSESRAAIRGLGIGGLLPPDGRLDLGDMDETGAMLLVALLAAHGFPAQFTGVGDAPMLLALFDFFRRSGAGVDIAGDAATLRPPRFPIPLDLALSDEARALVGPLLLHCTALTGRSHLHLPAGLTDPAEGLLTRFGSLLAVDADADGTAITVDGMAPLTAQALTVPGDPALAVYPAVAALIAPDSELTIESVALSAHGLALLDALALLGGDVTLGKTAQGPGIADITVRHAQLTGTAIAADLGIAPDDYAVLAVAAAFADGETRLDGLPPGARRLAISSALRANGVDCHERPGGLVIVGQPRVPGGGKLAARLDPKLAMSFLVLGMAADRPVTIDDGAIMTPLFPGFVSAFEHVGASFSGGDA